MVELCPITFNNYPFGNGKHTWWLISLSKWVITPIISGLTLLIPFITGVISHLRAVGWATKYHPKLLDIYQALFCSPSPRQAARCNTRGDGSNQDDLGGSTRQVCRHCSCLYIYTYTHIHIYTYAHIHIYTYTHMVTDRIMGKKKRST